MFTGEDPINEKSVPLIERSILKPSSLFDVSLHCRSTCALDTKVEVRFVGDVGADAAAVVTFRFGAGTESPPAL